MDSRNDSQVNIGVLLAGGSSRRAGVDKRLLVLEGRTLLQQNVDFLRDLFPTVAVAIGHAQTLDLGDTTGVEVLHDAWPGGSPLAGIATALQHFRRPVFALAVDIAFPQRRAAEAILAALAGNDVSLPATGAEHRQPLFAAYGPVCLAPMSAALGAGLHRIVTILPEIRVAEVPFPDDSLFHNINTMSDYEAARRRTPVREADDSGRQPALVAIVGKSDSGKTTLIEKVVPELVKLGLRVGTVKHDAHSFEIDHPGKDSWRHGQAGAEAYVIASPERLAFVTRLDDEVSLTDIVQRFFGGFDLVIAEGYKCTAPHRIEVFRAGAGHDEPLCAPGEAIALVTDSALSHEHAFGLEDGAGIAAFLVMRLDSLRRY